MLYDLFHCVRFLAACAAWLNSLGAPLQCAFSHAHSCRTTCPLLSAPPQLHMPSGRMCHGRQGCSQTRAACLAQRSHQPHCTDGCISTSSHFSAARSAPPPCAPPSHWYCVISAVGSNGGDVPPPSKVAAPLEPPPLAAAAAAAACAAATASAPQQQRCTRACNQGGQPGAQHRTSHRAGWLAGWLAGWVHAPLTRAPHQGSRNTTTAAMSCDGWCVHNRSSASRLLLCTN
jgi:hypothetical protein